MKNMKKTPEKDVVKKVRHYLENLKKRLEDIPLTSNVSVTYLIESEYEIQMGSNKKKADVVLLKRTTNRIEDTIVKNPLITVECKALGNKGDGLDQLKGYLCARDTPFGILAVGPQQGGWQYYRNHGGYKFETLSPRKTFETQVTDWVNSEATAEEKMEERINQAIEKQKNKLERENKARFQKIVIDLADKYQKQLDEAREDFQKRVTNLADTHQKQLTDLADTHQKQLNEAREDRFKKGFWVGAISIIVLVIVVAIIVSGS